MPPKRTISLTSDPSSSSGTKRRLPFKPPGPAKRAATESSIKASKNVPPRNSSSKSTSSKPSAATRRTSASKAKKPSRPTIASSSTEDEEDEEFGTTIDLDDIPGFSSPPEITATRLTNTRPNAQHSRPFISDSGSESATPPPPPVARHTSTSAAQDIPSDEDEDDEIEALREVSVGADTIPSRADANADPLDLSDASIPRLPAALLTRLMHEHMVDKNLKISKTANEVMRGYFDVFVREAVARAVEGKKEDDPRGGGGKGGLDDGDVWLDVGDLERVVPGLVLDF